MGRLNFLIACECSGTVRDAIRKAGHNALSVDLKASEAQGPHWQGDIFKAVEMLYRSGERFDCMIAFPDCTYLASSGLHWNNRVPGRAEKTVRAIEFVQRLWAIPIKYKALENPIGCLSTRWRKPTQIIQPYQFGEDASKATCLWLDGLPALQPTKRISGRIVTYKGKQVERWSNQTDSGQNKLPPSKTRATDRARFWPGVAAAMADQWIVHIIKQESKQ